MKKKKKETERKIKEVLKKIRRLVRLLKIANEYAEEITDITANYNFVVTIDMSIEIQKYSRKCSGLLKKLIDVYYYSKYIDTRSLKCESCIAVETDMIRGKIKSYDGEKYRDIKKLVEELIRRCE